MNKITAATNGTKWARATKAAGWKIHANYAHSSLHQISRGNGDYTCSNGGTNWFGSCDHFCNPRDVGSIETTLKGCGTATLDFGNCNSYACNVHAYIDGKRIATARSEWRSGEVLHKKVTFDFKDGSKLKITEGEEQSSGGDWRCMIIFNNFNVTSCNALCL